MKTNFFLTFLILFSLFFGMSSYGQETNMNKKTREAVSKQFNQWILKKNPHLKENIENKLNKNKEKVLKHFGKKQINENIITTFSIFSQALIEKQIKYQRIINKKEISINLKEDNLSFKVKFTY